MSQSTLKVMLAYVVIILFMICAVISLDYDHTLVLNPFQLANDDEEFHCAACGVDDSELSLFQSYYCCSSCTFNLHVECASIPTTLILKVKYPLHLFFSLPMNREAASLSCSICTKVVPTSGCWVFYNHDHVYLCHFDCAAIVEFSMETDSLGQLQNRLQTLAITSRPPAHAEWGSHAFHSLPFSQGIWFIQVPEMQLVQLFIHERSEQLVRGQFSHLLSKLISLNVTLNAMSSYDCFSQFYYGIRAEIANYLIFIRRTQQSHTPGLTLTGIKLIGPGNYTLWSKSLRLVLLGKNKLGFMDGTCMKNQYSGSLASLWERRNAIVLSWIGATVSPDLVSSIVYALDSNKVWDEFKERFEKSNLTRIYQLWKDIASLTQGTNSVTVYFSRMKNYWDKIDALVPTAGCSCEASRPSIELLRNQCLLQFLMGLNESFSHVRSDILLKTPTTPPTSHQYQMNQYPNYNQNQNYKSRSPLAPPGSVCDHCGYKGHLKTNCYRLVGYPPDFQRKKNLGSAGVPTKPYASSNVAEVKGTNDVKGKGRYISEDHYQELIGRGNKASTSGASHHITFDRECLDEVFKTTSSVENGGVQVPNGGKCEVTHTGSTKILRSHKLKNDLYTGRVLGIGKEDNGLYFLKDEPIAACLAGSTDREAEDDSIWHKRLGHPSKSVLDLIPVVMTNTNAHKPCEICLLAKQTRLKFPSSWGEDEDVFGVVTLEDKDIFGVHLPEMVTPPSLEIPVYLPQTSLPNMPSAGDDIQVPSMNVDPYPKPPAEIEKLRTTGRSVNPSVWLQDYVTGKKYASSSLYSIDKVLSYDRFSATYKASIHAFSTHVEPKSFKEAACDPNWVNAMRLEIQALEDNHTWDLVPLPVGVHASGSKWVFKIKYKANGDIERYKARLVAKGYSQLERLDYHDTFSPVAKMATLRTVIGIAAAKNWDLFHMDVNNAFH
ncbi:hypothetical protein KY289_010943 [Solanum tuberosum]|nr:hypothetical protein KY289_010943 [Solanum tuberosum]